MCLDRLTKVKVGNTGIGWKIYRRGDQRALLPQIRGSRRTRIGRTYSIPARMYPKILVTESAPYQKSYPCGFHVYLKKPSLFRTFLRSDEVLVKVRWKGPLAVGRQKVMRSRYFLPCVVVRTVTLLRREK